MHLLVVSFRNGEVQYIGPFPTYFKANEYGLALQHSLEGYARHHVVKLMLPVTMRVKFS
jgi:hypothetical protein